MINANRVLVLMADGPAFPALRSDGSQNPLSPDFEPGFDAITALEESCEPECPHVLNLNESDAQWLAAMRSSRRSQ